MNPDTERAAREIVRKASGDRKRPSRAMWIAALVVSGVCAGALAIGFVVHDTSHTATQVPGIGSARSTVENPHSGLASPLLLAIAAALVFASVAVARKR